MISASLNTSVATSESTSDGLSSRSGHAGSKHRSTTHSLRPAQANSDTSANAAVTAGTPVNTGAADGETTSDPEHSFAEIIRQIASAAKLSQADVPVTNSKPVPLFQPKMQVGTPDSESTVAVNRPGSQAKELSSPAPSFFGSATALTDSVSKERQAGMVAVPVDIVAPPVPVRPRLADMAGERAMEQPEIRTVPQGTPTAPTAAALNIVIRTGDQTAATQGDPATPNVIAIEGTAAPAIPYVPSTIQALVGETQVLPVPPVVGNINSVSTSPISQGSDIERKKTTALPLSGDSGVEAVKVSAPQTPAFQDFQLKAEPAKTTENASPRNDAPRPPPTAQEPLTPEKSPTQPLKSLSLEFTPDGARDVRVRLAERGGEVHVSLHSSDPTITKNLREGVTDLASVLAQAGYDADTWKSGHQPRQNSQQREQDEPQPSSTSSVAGTESFDGVLEQGALYQSREIL